MEKIVEDKEERSLQGPVMDILGKFSHELRNPLTTINNAVAMVRLKKENLSDDEKRMMEMAEVNVAGRRDNVNQKKTFNLPVY